MNKARREEISQVIADLEKIRERIEEIAGDEQSYYDNMPENLQSSSKGDAAEEAVSNLEEAAATVEDVISYLNEAQI